MSKSFYELVESEKLAFIADFGDYDYSWNEIQFYYSPSKRRYYWISDSGCSCNSFMDVSTFESLDELESGDRKAAISAAESFWGGTDDQKLTALAKIRDFQHA